MSISCKCSNFVATSSKLQTIRSFDVTVSPSPMPGIEAEAGAVLSTRLSQVFQEKYPRDFPFYTEFMDFFKHAYGPIPDLTVNVINQRELLFGLTLDAGGESWQLSICINCKDVLCAKRLTAGAGAGAVAGATSNQYLINSTLLSNGEELAQRRGLKSYSETFDLLVMISGVLSPPPPATGMAASSSSLSIGSLAGNPLDMKQQRLRQLLANKQARLQEEIKKTNERIERYAGTEFELLKSFREKADQDCAQLMHHIRQVPEHVAELLDGGMTPALEVTGNWLPSAAGARRRNTISSRRELSNPTTPTTTLNHPPNFLALNQQQQQQQPSQPSQPQLQPLSSAASSMASVRLRKMSNFDTPPATPEATPMSVGNSPTFRQQQQQQQSSVAAAPHLLATHGGGGGRGVTANGEDDADDCLFDLEDVEEYTVPQPVPVPVQSGYPHTLMYQRVHSIQPMQNGMVDDLDEADTADEAEDALDLDSSVSIPVGRAGRPTQAQLMNFARSLPIEMPNSTLAERAAVANNNNNNFALGCEEGLDNIDIAASIQALTKSVHGEAVFGDLPRPRLRSQIEG
ncbi:uncharacterized protein PRAS40 [Drosophila pseudoobscura]|uniref:Uncharacterized protein PRAS40 n=1 Tax=Drosophila pseudoobscura pseudoobscura TaxID=46245 RepID=A0A6I8UTY6_DROPS|nr:uncharacterized protein LOC4803956 [Drosophila pseudoobscura]